MYMLLSPSEQMGLYLMIHVIFVDGTVALALMIHER